MLCACYNFVYVYFHDEPVQAFVVNIVTATESSAAGGASGGIYFSTS